MTRFVLLHHDCSPSFARPSHWDFMIEMGNALRTWVLLELPTEWRTALAISSGALQEAVTAEQIGDHRLDYLEIEGPLSGDRGAVRRIEEGEYRVVSQSDNRLEVRLSGKRLRGTAILSRVEAGGDHWSLSWRSG
jgi:hypothetical protein